MKKKIKAILLFSGGLDCILAAKILQKQKIEVLGVVFKSYFFDEKQAKEMAKKIKLPLKVVDFSKEHLEMIKNPKYGYGKALNPCIDCHILMLKKAKEIMNKEKFDFVATGEVLGERPMSQNAAALKLIEKQSNLENYLLRPLSAKLLQETVPEKLGMIKTKELLGISGRSRKKQISLAEKFRIKNYPSPAGGCLLTDLNFGRKLKELFEKYIQCGDNDIGLLKLGRHFWQNKVKIIIGRNKNENEQMEKLRKRRDILMQLKNYPGPLALARNYGKNKIKESVLKRMKKMLKQYSSKAKNKKDIKFTLLNPAKRESASVADYLTGQK